MIRTRQIEVWNIDEHNPQFLTGSGTITVSEASPVGIPVLVLQADDADVTDVIRYTLREQSTSLPFVLLEDSGQLILRHPLDREVEDVYLLHVDAANQLGMEDTLTLQVGVLGSWVGTRAAYA